MTPEEMAVVNGDLLFAVTDTKNRFSAFQSNDADSDDDDDEQQIVDLIGAEQEENEDALPKLVDALKDVTAHVQLLSDKKAVRSSKKEGVQGAETTAEGP